MEGKQVEKKDDLLLKPFETLREVALMSERITSNPAIMGGRACICGLRIPVSVIAGQFPDIMTLQFHFL